MAGGQVSLALPPIFMITIGRRIIKFSGVKSWDNAVLRALDRTEKLPSDNGRYWNPMVIQFKLRD